MSHYTHHIDDSGKEPTIIEIKGEPYPEDTELHEFNRITARVAAALSAHMKVLREPRSSRDSHSWWHKWERTKIEMHTALAEYEKMEEG